MSNTWQKLAIKKRNKQEDQLLLQAAKNPRENENGQDVFQQILRMRSIPSKEQVILDTLRFLSKNGVDLYTGVSDLCNGDRMHELSWQIYEPGIKRLLALGYRPNKGPSPFGAIAWGMNFDEKEIRSVVQLLSEHGFPVNQKDTLGYTPLYCAVNDYDHARVESAYMSSSDGKDWPVTCALLEVGADPNIPNTYDGMTPLMATLPNPFFFEKLLLAGGNPKLRDYQGNDIAQMIEEGLELGVEDNWTGPVQDRESIEKCTSYPECQSVLEAFLK